MALASDETLQKVAGGARIAPSPGISFTADTTAVKLSAAATNFAGGFLVQNQSAGTMYIGDASVIGAGTGIALLAGGSMPIASSDASLWYARAASALAGVVVGMVDP